MASIKKRGNSYELRWRDASGKHRSKAFKKRRDAVSFKDHELAQGYDADNAKILFGELAAEWASNRLNVGRSSLARDETFYRRHVAPAFAQRELNSITTREIQAWVKTLVEKGLAPASVREAVRILNAILRLAVKSQLLMRNPREGVVLPKQDRKEQRFLSQQELLKLAQTIHPHFRALVLLSGTLGLRWGEAIALRRRDIDFLKRELRVRASIEEVNGDLRYSPNMKSKASRRDQILPSFLADELARHIATLPQDRDFVFASMQGQHLRRSNFTNGYWKPAVKRAGLEPLRFHDLRHTAATLAHEADHDLYDVSRMLGHARVGVTGDTYTHQSDARKRFLADALQKNFEKCTQIGTHDDDSSKVVGINRGRNIGSDQGE